MEMMECLFCCRSRNTAHKESKEAILSLINEEDELLEDLESEDEVVTSDLDSMEKAEKMLLKRMEEQEKGMLDRIENAEAIVAKELERIQQDHFPINEKVPESLEASTGDEKIKKYIAPEIESIPGPVVEVVAQAALAAVSDMAITVASEELEAEAKQAIAVEAVMKSNEEKDAPRLSRISNRTGLSGGLDSGDQAASQVPNVTIENDETPGDFEASLAMEAVTTQQGLLTTEKEKSEDEEKGPSSRGDLTGELGDSSRCDSNVNAKRQFSTLSDFSQSDMSSETLMRFQDSKEEVSPSEAISDISIKPVDSELALMDAQSEGTQLNNYFKMRQETMDELMDEIESFQSSGGDAESEETLSEDLESVTASSMSTDVPDLKAEDEHKGGQMALNFNCAEAEVKVGEPAFTEDRTDTADSDDDESIEANWCELQMAGGDSQIVFPCLKQVPVARATSMVLERGRVPRSELM